MVAQFHSKQQIQPPWGFSVGVTKITALVKAGNHVKSNLDYTRDIIPKRVTSGGIHLRDLAPGKHSSEETSQRWEAVGDTVSIWKTWESNPDLPHQ